MKSDQEFISNLVCVIERNYPIAKFGVHGMAAEMGISDRQLQRKVKALTGQTPVQYLRDFRLERSLKLLRDRAPIGQVAKAVGFSSHAYFTSCFRAHFGITPQQVLDEPIRITSNDGLASQRRNVSHPH